MLVHVMPVAAQQRLGPGDQGVEVQFALLLGFVVGAAGIGQARRTGHHISSSAHELVGVGDRHLLCHVAHLVALIGIGRELHCLAMLVEITQPG